MSQTLPPYPESAVKNKEEGTVALTVLIGTDGRPLKIVSISAHDAAPDLIQAASNSVMQHWRFEPKLKNGKPIEGHARVPVEFELNTPTPKSSSATSHAASASSKT